MGAMLEGGNHQLHEFYSRHALSPSSSLPEEGNKSIIQERYRTNAAKFYKKNLAHHVLKIGEQTHRYKGREAYRQQKSANWRGNIQARVERIRHEEIKHIKGKAKKNNDKNGNFYRHIFW